MDEMTKVKDINGKLIDFEAAMHLMDGDIREELANSSDFDIDQEFIEEHAKRHAEKHDGEEFAPYYGLAW